MAAPPTPPTPPRHSKLGNPYPHGIPPVVVDARVDGTERTVEPDPLTGCRPSAWRFVTPDPCLPHVPLYVPPRLPGQTDAQWDASVLDTESYHADVTMVALHAMQLLATYVGNFATCENRACRRKRRCAATRDPFAFGLFLAMFPPCVPLDIEIIWTYIEEVRRELRAQRAASMAGAGGGAGEAG